MKAFLGQDVLDNRKEFPDLPEEFFALIDPEGTNVVQEEIKVDSEFRCVCQFKFRDRASPFEAYVTIPEELYMRIVHEIDISSLGKVH